VSHGVHIGLEKQATIGVMKLISMQHPYSTSTE